MARSMPEEVVPQKARTTLSVGGLWDNKYLQLKFPSEKRQMKKTWEMTSLNQKFHDSSNVQLRFLPIHVARVAVK